MARMRNMASKLGSMKPVAWLKKHWLKVVIAIVVVYAIYWFFFQDMDLEHATGATPTLEDLEKAMDDAKAAWDAAAEAEKTYKGNCNSVAVTPSTTPGCPAYTSAKQIEYDTAKKAYDDASPPKKKKSKKASSFRSKVNSFFGGIGKSFKRSTDKTKKKFKKTGN